MDEVIESAPRPVHKACKVKRPDQDGVVTKPVPTYRLIDSPSNDLVALGVLQKNHLPRTPSVVQNTSQPVAASLEAETKPACSPVRVGQCFCVCTVEYD
jgi:hypothetical protein